MTLKRMNPDTYTVSIYEFNADSVTPSSCRLIRWHWKTIRLLMWKPSSPRMIVGSICTPIKLRQVGGVTSIGKTSVEGSTHHLTNHFSNTGLPAQLSFSKVPFQAFTCTLLGSVTIFSQSWVPLITSALFYLYSLHSYSTTLCRTLQSILTRPDQAPWSPPHCIMYGAHNLGQNASQQPWGLRHCPRSHGHHVMIMQLLTNWTRVSLFLRCHEWTTEYVFTWTRVSLVRYIH